MRLADLETPRLVLDAGRMEANVARLKSRLAPLGVRLRPHVKTCKSIEVARGLMDSPAGPITVSTLKEAEQFFAHGVTDIFYAVGIAPSDPWAVTRDEEGRAVAVHPGGRLLASAVTRAGYSADTAENAREGAAKLVWINPQTGKSIPLPEAMRTATL